MYIFPNNFIRAEEIGNVFEESSIITVLRNDIFNVLNH